MARVLHFERVLLGLRCAGGDKGGTIAPQQIPEAWTKARLCTTGSTSSNVLAVNHGTYESDPIR
jgi:hypothetical protein